MKIRRLISPIIYSPDVTINYIVCAKSIPKLGKIQYNYYNYKPIIIILYYNNNIILYILY